MHDCLFEVAVSALEGAHYEPVEGEEVHPAAVVDQPRFGYLNQLQEFLPSELNPVRA